LDDRSWDPEHRVRHPSGPVPGYWDTFYGGQRVSAAPADPSPFANWVDQNLDPGVAVVEIACGNGRDASFFAERGRRVFAVDQSPAAIRLVTEMAHRKGLQYLQAVAVAVEELSNSLGSRDVRSLLGDGEVAVYARFFLHAIAEDAQEAFFAWLRAFLRGGECCFLEYRAADLSADQYEFGDHYRRPISSDKLAMHCRAAEFEVVSSDESCDYAPYRDERPLVGRTVIRKSTE
jgi:SAM-dependent methyltransferase